MAEASSSLLPPGPAFWRRIVNKPSARGLQLLELALRGFIRDRGVQRASGLAFDTVLGLVPFLAFLVSALKGFGVYQSLMAGAIRPGIIATMGAMGAEQNHAGVGLLSVFLKVLDVVERANFGTVGLVGLAFLLYVVVLLLVSVEGTMNHVFGVEKARTLTRRITDYSAILFISPIAAILAAAVASGGGRLGWLRGGFFSQLSATSLMAVSLTILYWVMPCRKVRLVSAAWGGLVAGVVWYAILVIHVRFQIGVARYNALYSTFAVIPLLLVWIFVSWIIVLFGAELAAAHDKPELFAFRTLGSNVDHSTRIYIVLQAFATMTERSLAGAAPLQLDALAERAGLPVELLRQELQHFVDAEYLVRSASHGELTYVLARDLDTIRLGDLLKVLEKSGCAPDQNTSREDRLWRLIDSELLARDSGRAAMTLRQFAGWMVEEPTQGLEAQPAEVAEDQTNPEAEPS